MSTEPSATEEEALRALSRSAAAVGYADLPEDVSRHAKYVWLDTLGVILAGSAEPYVELLAARATRENGRATLLRRGCPRAERATAALVNGIAGTVLELDEGHRPTGHPAIYVIPALLAAAERRALSGRNLLASLVAGYEVGARLAAASTLRRDVHVHGAIAPAAAAAAVSHLFEEDEESIGDSIRVGACLSLAAPFRAAFEGALVRNAYAGVAGVIGLAVYDLVSAGFDGFGGALADVHGGILGTAFAADRLVSDLGNGYLISTNYFKVHAACRYTHSALDAVEVALGDRELSAGEVERVVVECDSNAARCNRPDPNNALAAKFSIPFAIATRLVNGSTAPDAFRNEVTADPTVRRVAERVSVSGIEAGMPQGELPSYPARVEIHLASGERLEGEVARPRGDHPDPISYSDVEGKFLELTAPVLGPAGGRSVRDLVLQFEEITADELMAAIRSAGSEG